MASRLDRICQSTLRSVFPVMVATEIRPGNPGCIGSSRCMGVVDPNRASVTVNFRVVQLKVTRRQAQLIRHHPVHERLVVWIALKILLERVTLEGIQILIPCFKGASRPFKAAIRPDLTAPEQVY